MNRLQSDFLKLNWYDLAKGFIVAFLTVFVAAIISTIEARQLPTLAELEVAAYAGLSGGIGYLIKNFVTNSQGTIGTKTAPTPMRPVENDNPYNRA
jgi:hypothetical protein